MKAVVDTGPLISLLHERDGYHEWTKTSWRLLTTPLITCEAVVVEAMHVLSRLGSQPGAVLEFLNRGKVVLSFSLASELESVSRLLAKYKDVPMSLADACLVRMSELNPERKVFTLDSDFKVYRKNGRQFIPTLAPD